MGKTPSKQARNKYDHPIDPKYVVHDKTHEFLEEVEIAFSEVDFGEWAINEDWTIETQDRKATLVTAHAFKAISEETGIDDEEILYDARKAHEQQAVEMGLNQDQPVYYAVTSK